MFMTAEYRRGLIRTTLAASPRRGRVLAAKALVVGAVAFVAGLLGAVGRGDPRQRPRARPRIPRSSPAVADRGARDRRHRRRLSPSSPSSPSPSAAWCAAAPPRSRRHHRDRAAVLPGRHLVLPPARPTGCCGSPRPPPSPSSRRRRSTRRSRPTTRPCRGYFPLAPWAGFAVLCAWALAALGGGRLPAAPEGRVSQPARPRRCTPSGRSCARCPAPAGCCSPRPRSRSRSARPRRRPALRAVRRAPAPDRRDPAKLSLTGVELGQAVVAIARRAGDQQRVQHRHDPRHADRDAAAVAVLAAKAAVVGRAGAGRGSARRARLGARRTADPARRAGFTAAHGYPPLSLGNGPDLRAAGGSVLYLALIALLALGVATAVRDSAVGDRARPRPAVPVPDRRQRGPRPALAAAPGTDRPDDRRALHPGHRGLKALPLTPWQGLGVLAAWAGGALLLGAPSSASATPDRYLRCGRIRESPSPEPPAGIREPHGTPDSPALALAPRPPQSAPGPGLHVLRGRTRHHEQDARQTEPLIPGAPGHELVFRPPRPRYLRAGEIRALQIDPTALGRASCRPGWRWSGRSWCARRSKLVPVEHVGLVLSGQAVAKMDDGPEVVMRAERFLYVPPAMTAGSSAMSPTSRCTSSAARVTRPHSRRRASRHTTWKLPQLRSGPDQGR